MSVQRSTTRKQHKQFKLHVALHANNRNS